MVAGEYSNVNRNMSIRNDFDCLPAADLPVGGAGRFESGGSSSWFVGWKDRTRRNSTANRVVCCVKVAGRCTMARFSKGPRDFGPWPRVERVESEKEKNSMKVMVTWRTRPGLYKKAVEQFLNTGGKPPKGVKTVGRWHVPGSILGWHLLETDNLTGIAQHAAEWADVIDLEIHAVIEDGPAAEAAKRVFGK